jgi:hypothetical protein
LDINQLQPFQRTSLVYQAVFTAEDEQFATRQTNIDDFNAQLFVDTATWALSIYEIELNIPVEPSKPMSERRTVIKSKLRGTGQIDASLIKLVADSYSNGDVAVLFDGSIKITFTGVLGIPPNMQDLRDAIEDIKPAHLGVEYNFTYITFGQLQDSGKTFGDIEAAGLTFGQLETTLP